MILALWLRWTQSRHLRWLAVIVAFLIVDALVGSTIIAWEVEMLRKAL